MGRKVQLQLYDSVSADFYVPAAQHLIVRNADAHIILFDITNRQSFRNVRA